VKVIDRDLETPTCPGDVVFARLQVRILSAQAG
jgi:hypothetical protein